MPIRMVDDENNASQNNIPNRPSGGGNGGGGGLGGGLISVLLGLVFRNPKLLIPILIIGIGWFAFTRGCHTAAKAITHAFSKGCDMKQEVYDQAAVYEPLAHNDEHPLPEKISLLKYCPDRLNQGQQGSCVAWSSAYAARTILEAERTGEDPNSVAFSPSFLYNQIKLGEDCQGSYIQKAMDQMKFGGLVPFSKFRYDEEDCHTQPDNDLKQLAKSYTMKGFTRLTMGGDEYTPDLDAIRQHLANGSPVVIGMMVGGSFMQNMENKKVWIPEQEDYDMNGFGGHALCVIGYDDYLEGGAFQIMNSWGKDWGEDGIAYVRYNDFKYFVKEAYGLWPMGQQDENNIKKYNVSFGLLNNATKEYISLKNTENNEFESVGKIPKNTTFKIEVTNSIECYVYIFGQETDGSSYILFPYTPKHSPFCGITGTRLFPKDKSLLVDNIGTKDCFAILFTKSPIDFNKVNTAINASKANGYADKLNEVFKDEMIKDIRFNDGEKVNFETDTKGGNAVVAIISIQK